MGRNRVKEVQLMDLKGKSADSQHEKGVAGKHVVKIRPKDPKYKCVLCIDGGGLKGLVAGVVLQYLEQEIVKYIVKNGLGPKGIPESDLAVDLSDYFDIISGTSVGSILALYFATKGADSGQLLRELGCDTVRPGSARGIVEIIRGYAEKIFPRSWIYKKDWMRTLIWMILPLYSPEPLKNLLRRLFPSHTLKDLNTSVMVPTFELKEEEAFTFWSSGKTTGYAVVNSHTHQQALPRVQKITPDGHRLPDIDVSNGVNYTLWEVALASCAAPTYFPAATATPIEGKGPCPGKFIDGGVFAGNPTFLTIVLVLLGVGSDHDKRSLDKLAVLSVGTCSTLPDTEGLATGGLYQWMKSGALSSIIMGGTSQWLQSLVDAMYYDTSDKNIAQYVRINQLFTTDSEDGSTFRDMDDPKKVPALIEAGEKLGQDYSKVVLPDFVERFIMA